MKIIEMALREKHMNLISAKENNMNIRCITPSIQIFNDVKTTFDIYKTIHILISKNTDKTNGADDIIANFSLSYQFRISLQETEKFIEKDFNDKIIPLYYEKLNNMITEFGLPPISFSIFLNSININDK